MQEAAQWLLDQDDLGKSEARWQAQQEQQQREAAQAAKREKESRKQLLAKYDLQAVTSGPSPVAETKRQSNSKPVSKVCPLASAAYCLSVIRKAPSGVPACCYQTVLYTYMSTQCCSRVIV